MTQRPHFLVHESPDHQRVLDPDDVYFLAAEADDTQIRLRSRRLLTDVRRLAELEAILGPQGFVRIHRSTLVNPTRVAELRRRTAAKGWEVVMQSPVNAVLPVAEGRLGELREAFL